jgi:hypothetical protein
VCRLPDMLVGGIVEPGMPVTNKLAEDGHILYRVVSDPWQVEDLLCADEQVRVHYDHAEHKVHLLVNVSDVHRIPPAVFRLGRGMTITHPNSGHIILVGATTLTRRLSETVFRIAKFDRAHFFDVEEDAWTYLRQIVADERC